MNPLPIGPDGPVFRDYGSGTLLIGDVRDGLRWIKEQGIRVQMAVTSPPYWGLRDYGCEGQLGLESTPHEYVQNLVEVFRLVRDVLADDGVLWLNLGDSYSGSGINDGSKNPGLSRAALGFPTDKEELRTYDGSFFCCAHCGKRYPSGETPVKHLMGPPDDWELAVMEQLELQKGGSA